MKKYRYLILIVSVLVMVALTVLLGAIVYQYKDHPDKFQSDLESLGLWGPVVFFLLNVAQVILAIIPGGPFEIVAGALWPGLRGALLCDLAMTTGGVITFLLSRKYGMSFIELFTTREKIESVKFLKTNRKSTTLLFLFFLFPGSPKDLMCYVVGLSDLKLIPWIFINLVGRFPAIYISTLSGAALGENRILIFVLLLAIILLLYGVGTLLYNRLNREQSPAEEKTE